MLNLKREIIMLSKYRRVTKLDSSWVWLRKNRVVPKGLSANHPGMWPLSPGGRTIPWSSRLQNHPCQELDLPTSGPEPAKDTPGYAENHQGPALPTSMSAAGPTTTEGPMPYIGPPPEHTAQVTSILLSFIGSLPQEAISPRPITTHLIHRNKHRELGKMRGWRNTL